MAQERAWSRGCVLLPQLCPRESPCCRAVRAPEGAGGLCRGLGGCARSLPKLCGASVCRVVHGLNPAAEAAVGGLELLAAGDGVSAPAHGALCGQPFPGRGSCSWHCRLLPDPAGSSCLGCNWLKGKLYAFEGKQRLSELLSSEARSCPLCSPHNGRPAPPVRLS